MIPDLLKHLEFKFLNPPLGEKESPCDKAMKHFDQAGGMAMLTAFITFAQAELGRASINDLSYSDGQQILALSSGVAVAWPGVTDDGVDNISGAVPVFGNSGRPQRSIEERAIQTTGPSKPQETERL